MNKVFAVVVATTLACSVQAQESSTLKKVSENNFITVAHRESSIPFSYLVDGKPIGFGFDICMKVVDKVKAIIKKPNLEIKLQNVTSQNRIPLLRNGTVDIECGSTTNNSQRGEQVAFATNYFYTGTRLLAKKSSKIKSYEDLRGKTLATTTGTTNFQVMNKFNKENNMDMKIIFGKDHDDSFLLVETDRALAFAMDDILLYGLAAGSKNPGEWEVVADALQVEPYAIMVRKDDVEFKKIVDDVIAQLIKTGEFDKLYKKWFQSPIPPKGINLNVPMSKELRDNLKNLSDKPAI